MRKRILSSLLALVFCLGLLPATALAANPDSSIAGIPEGLEIEGTKVTGYTGDATELTIPEGVTEIGENAFAENKTVTEFILPSTLTTIGTGAFATDSSNNLNLILNIPDSVTVIGEKAFAGRDVEDLTVSLKTLLCESVNTYAFWEMSTADSPASYAFTVTGVDRDITLGYGELTVEGKGGESGKTLNLAHRIVNCVTSAPGASFTVTDQTQDSSQIKAIIYVNGKQFGSTKENRVIQVVDGDFVILNGVLEGYSGNNAEVNIPGNAGITAIGRHVFIGKKDVTSVTVPNGVTSIGEYAFNASGIISMNLPESVTEIGEHAFGNTNSLTEITMPGVQTIGSYAFYQSGITSITLPNVITIEDSAFHSASSLTSIEMPKVQTIGDNAFARTKLTEFTVPKSVTQIGSSILYSNSTEKLSISLETLLSTAIAQEAFSNSLNEDCVVELTDVDRNITLLPNGIETVVEGEKKDITFTTDRYDGPFQVSQVPDATDDIEIINETGANVVVNDTTVPTGNAKPVTVTSDAYLASLALDGGAVTLDPVFSNYKHDMYAATVNSAQVSITAVPSGSNATVTVGNRPANSENSYTVTVELTEGDNSIPVVVTAQDGVTAKTYTLNVTRQASVTHVEIGTAEDLMRFAREVNDGIYDGNTDVAVELTGNIDLSGQTWTPIGVSEDHFFSGTFDGKEHTISGLQIELPEYGVDDSVGLFGYTTGTIQNLTLSGSVSGMSTGAAGGLGPIAGMAGEGCVIRNCKTKDFAITIDKYLAYNAGGIVGQAEKACIESCVSDTALSAGAFSLNLGGIVGRAEATKVINCVYQGTITLGNGFEPAQTAGGIAGSASGGSQLSYNTNNGTINAEGTGVKNTGGIAGSLDSASIDHSINNGDLSGNGASMGGIVGSIASGTGTDTPVIDNGINKGEVENTSSSGGTAGGIAGDVDTSATGTIISNSISQGTVSTGEGGKQHPITPTAPEGGQFSNNHYDSSITATDGTPTNDELGAEQHETEEMSTQEFIEGVNKGGGDLAFDEGGPQIPAMPYAVTIAEGGENASGAGEYRPGELVTVNAGTKSGYTFQEWLAEGVTLSEDEKSKPEITFEMPEQAVTLTATWSAVSSGSSRPSYQPDVEDTEGGTVTVSPTRPRKGDTVTITPKPDEGYMVYEVAVTDRDGDPVKVTAKGDGTYTFTQPSGKVTIEVTFREKKAPGLPFTDLEPGAWYYDAVEYVYENGLMAGTSGTTFSPNGITTRGQIVTILYRLAGSPDIEEEIWGYPYADVDAAAYYGTAVYWARLNGIASGYNDEHFSPDDSITREQMVVMLYRYAKAMGYEVTGRADLTVYADAEQVSAFAQEAMEWAVGGGIISGTSDTTLSPQGQASRAQNAVIMMRFCERFVEN